MIATSAELETLRECGKRLAAILRRLEGEVQRPGISTAELGRLAEELIEAEKGEPVFKGYRAEPKGRPFPAALCVSINDEVVHGIPRKDRILKAGDLVGLDIGMRWPASGGLITDTARTLPVGNPSADVSRLLRGTRDALEAGIRALKPGIRMGDLGATIQEYLEGNGLAVIRELVGHGVGRKLHEDPYVPNYGDRGSGIVIRKGMVLAIEPMASLGGGEVELAADGWTWRTADGSPAAHFEHTVFISDTGAEVLTR